MQKLDLGRAFADGLERYKKDPVGLSICGFTVGALSFASLGIVAGPLYVGLYLILMGDEKGRPAHARMFEAFPRFWPLFGAFLLKYVVVAAGFLLGILPGLLLLTWWVYLFALLARWEEMGVGAALARSMDLVNEGGFMRHVALAVILLVVVGGSFLIPLVGPLASGILLPFGLSIIIAALDQLEEVSAA